jgi:DNA-binding MarR family transcriptional regulator
MSAVSDDGRTDLTGTVAHLLGRVGAVVTDRYAEAVAEYGVRPKHVGLLVAIAQRGPSSQLDLARMLGVAPSLVVALADDLEDQGSIVRTRDPDDRRRQRLVLTPAGRELIERCATTAEIVSQEVTVGLSETDREDLRRLLSRMLADLGLDPRASPTN